MILRNHPWGLTTRLRPGPDGELQSETLVLTVKGSFHPLLGASSRGELSLGPPLELYEKDAGGVRRPFRAPADTVSGDPAYVHAALGVFYRCSHAVYRLHATTRWSWWRGTPLRREKRTAWARTRASTIRFTRALPLSVFFCVGHAVYCLHGDNTVELVAGHPEEEGDVDGLGPEARLKDPTFLSTGSGRSSLYALVRGINDRVARLEPPAGWQTGAAGAAAADTAAGSGAGEQRMRVTTLPFRAACGIRGLAHIPSGAPDGSLVFTTLTALYRLPLGEGGAASPAPVLLAGREGEEGTVDCRREAARFQDICGGLTVDSGGNVVLVAGPRAQGPMALRHIAPDGTVTTLATLDDVVHHPAILPNGNLALCQAFPPSLLVLDLGLKPTPLLPPAPPAPVGPPRRTLHADMGALLDAQPDGTADLILVVGGRRFPVHRAILIARCDYFRSQLEGGFGDGAAAELSLPDTDPAAFELLLRFVYTGAVDMPSALAPAVAELADRLLLPELCSDAQAVVLSGVSAETVAWYLEHHEEVLERAEGSVERLSAESPRLIVELHKALLGGRSSKRQRTV
ncbi:hypothetical protein HYH03_001952 [Edaphochlamys debaryana]|uniref:BTB domain-containing protein n=1 Tax=Edaphochlamys debaryana TaxID=47281 RepID=A0A835YFQ1_9CHLO|nr:hypothetical protein HYH03_001952 [Edaphochlamys debaryana]|eukprot:KAG2500378.1 hypothetical protein HYH03_001952 [Edaphochlamys debaryana]